MLALRESAIMKVKITNSLKPPLMKRPSETGYWELNEIPGCGGCLRQKKTRELINFWISEVKQFQETLANEQSQNGRGVHQIDKIAYAQDGGSLKKYMRAREDVGRIEKLLIRSARIKWMPEIMSWNIFCVLVRPSILEHHHQQGKCRSFFPS